MTIFWVDPTAGSIIQATSDDGEAPRADAVAVKVPPAPAPESGKQKWNGAKWSPPPLAPPDPDDELDTALAEVQARLANVSTVAGLKATLDDAINAMRGRTGRAGRIAGRPV